MYPQIKSHRYKVEWKNVAIYIQDIIYINYKNRQKAQSILEDKGMIVLSGSLSMRVYTR